MYIKGNCTAYVVHEDDLYKCFFCIGIRTWTNGRLFEFQQSAIAYLEERGFRLV